MPTPPSSEEIRKKITLNKYLNELALLTGRPVRADELGSLEQAKSIREASQKFYILPVKKWSTLFSERLSDRFGEFVQALQKANSSSIYIWTPHTIDCGTFLFSSLSLVKFDFDFAINKDGILVFLTSDLNDRLLLDFSVSHEGERVMKVETQGENWAEIEY